MRVPRGHFGIMGFFDVFSIQGIQTVKNTSKNGVIFMAAG
jgi:hypothetical protein